MKLLAFTTDKMFHSVKAIDTAGLDPVGRKLCFSRTQSEHPPSLLIFLVEMPVQCIYN